MLIFPLKHISSFEILHIEFAPPPDLGPDLLLRLLHGRGHAEVTLLLHHLCQVEYGMCSMYVVLASKPRSCGNPQCLAQSSKPTLCYVTQQVKDLLR